MASVDVKGITFLGTWTLGGETAKDVAARSAVNYFSENQYESHFNTDRF